MADTTPTDTTPTGAAPTSTLVPNATKEVGFQENWKYRTFIDTLSSKDPKDDKGAKYVELSGGISSVIPASSDTTENSSYWPDAGNTTTDVTGTAHTFNVTGNRLIGDACQDFIAGLAYKTGDLRKTLIKQIGPDGHTLVAQVTISNIVAWGGNANAKGTFSFTMSINGKPVIDGSDVENASSQG